MERYDERDERYLSMACFGAVQASYDEGHAVCVSSDIYVDGVCACECHFSSQASVSARHSAEEIVSTFVDEMLESPKYRELGDDERLKFIGITLMPYRIRGLNKEAVAELDFLIKRARDSDDPDEQIEQDVNDFVESLSAPL